MSRRAPTEVRTGEDHDQVVTWYRDKLAEPATFPWANCEWEPVRVGPTWQTTDDGHWLLPDASIGWDVLGWCGTELRFGDQPWRFTLEQARFLLWWYAVDEHGKFLFRDGVLQRLKGWGKDPVAACQLYVEQLGPSRVAYMDKDQPVAIDCAEAWCQAAATALEQTKNTMRLMPALLSPAARSFYQVHIGREQIHALGDRRLIQAITSSPATLEGARGTFVQKNETQHWLRSNDGHEMARVIDRNATKSPDGAARSLAYTNAPDPSEDSVAQRDREAWELASAGGSLTTGILYDSLEANPESPLTAEAAVDVVTAIRGDSVWLDPARIVQFILDTRNPPSTSRRFWYNQITATEDAWVDPQEFDQLARPKLIVKKREPIALFFDGSKSDDDTGVIGCRISDGHAVTLGHWRRPPGYEAKERWVVDRHDVDLTVSQVFEDHNVIAFWADPSHTLEDVTEERFWDALIDEWHRRWKDQLDPAHWAQPKKHAVMWDMAGPAHTAEFTAAAERCVSDIEDQELSWDGDPRLRRHVHNAKRFPNRYGVSLWKGHRESARKVDLAVCMVGARMLRRLVLNSTPAKARSGRVW